jgi:hypothetical protein
VDWYKKLSLTEEGGTKLYGVSGKVKNPGAWELPMGTPMREILEGHAGGMRDGLRFRGLLPGGASTDFLVEEHLDLAMDYTTIGKAGSRMGTGTMIVLDDQTCPVARVQPSTLLRAGILRWCTPAGMVCRMSPVSWKRLKKGTAAWKISINSPQCVPIWGQATPFARSPPARPSLCRARSNISAPISRRIFARRSAPGATRPMATLHIDGKSYEVEAGENLLHVALSLGLDLPYFCWHPALGSVGACRQCACKQYRDENDKQGRLVMAV